MITNNGLYYDYNINNNSTELPSLIPLDWVYYSVHIVAWIMLVTSIICSVITIIWQQRTASSKQFFRRKLGERLVVYLAVTDIFFSITHFGDHLFTFLGRGHPPHIPCIVFSVVLMENMIAQSMVVFMTAVSLCLLVTCNRKISFGPRDVGLLLVSYGGPLIVVATCGLMGYFGNQGYW